MAFIDEVRDRFGVTADLPRADRARRQDRPVRLLKRPPSARSVRDERLANAVWNVFWAKDKGRGICGARKIWRLLARDGVQVARCTVERLMRAQGLKGVRHRSLSLDGCRPMGSTSTGPSTEWRVTRQRRRTTRRASGQPPPRRSAGARDRDPRGAGLPPRRSWRSSSS